MQSELSACLQERNKLPVKPKMQLMQDIDESASSAEWLKEKQ